MDKTRHIHVTLVHEKPSESSKLAGYLRQAFAILKIVTAALALVFAVMHRADIAQLLRSIRSVEALGVKIDIPAAAEALKVNHKGPRISDASATAAVRRALENIEHYRGATILWIDDHPENNRAFQRLLHELGAEVIISINTLEAREQLNRRIFDIIISDIRRDDSGDEDPMAFAEEASRSYASPYIIFFVLEMSGGNKPPFVFGITNRSDELLNLITDALGRGPRAQYEDPRLK